VLRGKEKEEGRKKKKEEERRRKKRKEKEEGRKQIARICFARTKAAPFFGKKPDQNKSRLIFGKNARPKLRFFGQGARPKLWIVLQNFGLFCKEPDQNELRLFWQSNKPPSETASRLCPG
jgi:hypothetical protein